MLGKLPLLLILVAMAGIIFLATRYPNTKVRIALIALTAAIGVPLLYLANFYSIFNLLEGFTRNIGDALGVSPKLSIGVTVLLVVPFAYAVTLLFSVSQQKRLTGQILLSLGIAGYWFALWYATEDHMLTAEGGKLKCYTLSQDGVRYFEKEQTDPRTGEKCQWVDQTNIHYIQAIDRKLRSGKPLAPITFKSIDDIKFFATGTRGAIPLIWYYRNSDGSYEFYDASGVHPIYGTPLTPITPKVAREWTDKFKAEWAKREDKVSKLYDERRPPPIDTQRPERTETRPPNNSSKPPSYIEPKRAILGPINPTFGETKTEVGENWRRVHIPASHCVEFKPIELIDERLGGSRANSQYIDIKAKYSVVTSVTIYMYPISDPRCPKPSVANFRNSGTSETPVPLNRYIGSDGCMYEGDGRIVLGFKLACDDKGR